MAEHAPGARFVPATSNAAAAQMVAAGEADAAAAPLRAADLFDLQVHATGVADMDTARTRFLLVGPEGTPPAPTGEDRTSVVFQTPNEPGALVAILQEFAERGVNMTRIESRPTRQEPNTYNFFVDLAGHVAGTKTGAGSVADALDAVRGRASWYRFLGSWPRASRLDDPGPG